MRRCYSIFLFCGLILCLTFTSFFPFSSLSGTGGISKNDVEKINTFHETENVVDLVESLTKLLNLDWEDVQYFLPPQTNFRIFDVKSGKEFIATRIGGKSHAEIIPASEEDYAILYNICENDFTWKRYPVCVEVKANLWTIASLCGYPHGDNGNIEYLSGHFCLHFNGSTTHGTKRSDLKSQTAIKKAYKQREQLEKSLKDLDAISSESRSN